MQYDPSFILAKLSETEIIFESHLRAVRGWCDEKTAKEIYEALSRMKGKAKATLEACKMNGKVLPTK